MERAPWESANNNKNLEQRPMWATSFTSLSAKNIPWLFIWFDQTTIQPNKARRVEKERLMVQEEQKIFKNHL
jgi:hypothetical protein